jgi:hypothetical protein
MPTTATKTSAKATKKPAAKKAAGRSKADAAPDALDLLIADHKEVKGLFKAYEKLVKAEAEADEKQALAQQICTLLTAHATVEEELVYPAARSLLGDDEDLVDQADVEHARRLQELPQKLQRALRRCHRAAQASPPGWNLAQAQGCTMRPPGRCRRRTSRLRRPPCGFAISRVAVGAAGCRAVPAPGRT